MLKEEDFIKDEDFLEKDGSIPVFVENCTHGRMWEAPKKGLFAGTACKDCGQILISDIRKGKTWMHGRGRISLPVTIEKITMHTIPSMLCTPPNHAK